MQALAVIGQEPVWVFSAEGGPTSLAQARGARLAIGFITSSSFMAASAMLEFAGVRLSDVRIGSQTGMAASQALIDGKVDLVFQAGGEDAQAVQMLMRQPGIQLLGTEHAGALAARESHLRALLLPQGAIELRGDIPPRDLTLMSVQTHLLVRPNMHPALQRALLDAALEIHEAPSFLQRHGEFPSFRGSDFPLSPVAKATAWAAGRGWKVCCRTERPNRWSFSLLRYCRLWRSRCFC